MDLISKRSTILLQFGAFHACVADCAALFPKRADAALFLFRVCELIPATLKTFPFSRSNVRPFGACLRPCRRGSSPAPHRAGRLACHSHPSVECCEGGRSIR